MIYTPTDRLTQTPEIKSLEDVLIAAKASSDGIALSEKFQLARLLALAVLRFHSTPWLKNGEWQSQDIVFLGVQDFSRDPLRMPFLRTPVRTHSNSSTPKQLVVTSSNTEESTVITSHHLRSPIRNQTLYGLGVMLIELAYDAPIQSLQLPQDDQGDPHTLYWAALRLGDRVWRELGPKFAEAVKICLYGGFGASSELQDVRVQKLFFEEVVKKLEICAEAVAI